jgi:hypothetical protein
MLIALVNACIYEKEGIRHYMPVAIFYALTSAIIIESLPAVTPDGDAKYFQLVIKRISCHL